MTRIGFCPGDRLYWGRNAGAYLPYRGKQGNLPEFLDKVLVEKEITDLIMLGDGRSIHKTAIDAARRSGGRVQPWIVEHGYLRPGLVAIEPWGMGGRSLIPQLALETPYTPDEYNAPEPQPSSFLRYAALDVGYHVSNLALSWINYPNYRPHALDGPIREYSGWVMKALKRRQRRKAQQAAQAEIEATSGPIFLLPLQLETDYQIRDHGTGDPLQLTLGRIIASFANHAPQNARLVVKVHPLDNGLTPWAQLTSDTALEHRILDRVTFLDGGQIEQLLDIARGVVTVNSTVGLTSLIQQVPTHVMGKAVYKQDGLNDPQALDLFWQNPVKPDAARMRRFRDILQRDFHVAGSFDGPGALDGARNLALHLSAHPPTGTEIKP